MCDFVEKTQAFVAKAGIACAHHVPIYQEASNAIVPPAKVWKPTFIIMWKLLRVVVRQFAQHVTI